MASTSAEDDGKTSGEKRKIESSPGSSKSKKAHLFDVKLNSLFDNKEFKVSFAEAFKTKKRFSSIYADIFPAPFPHCIISNFLNPYDYVQALQNDMRNFDFEEKHNDLYNFFQSEDLAATEDEHLKLFMGCLTQFRSWLSDVGGFTFEEKIDISASKYEYGNYLLCHNDQLDTRCIAFIYYLAPDWQREDGGILELFDNFAGVPEGPGATIVPRQNMMLFFEVTPTSYHQVTEVLSQKSRYTISGWLHSKFYNVSDEDDITLDIQYPLVCSDALPSFISSMYLDASNLDHIRSAFEQRSEIMLPNFLKYKAFKAVEDELKATESWSIAGPPNKRSYYVLKRGEAHSETRRLFDFFHSIEFLKYLSNAIGLKLLDDAHRSTSDSDSDSSLSEASDIQGSPSSRPDEAHFVSEITKWSHRSYTLLYDSTTSRMGGLDGIMFFCCDREWLDSDGGMIHYIDPDEGDTLLSIGPMNNAFALVLHNDGVRRFTHYINNSVNERPEPYYFTMNTTYFESHL